MKVGLMVLGIATSLAFTCGIGGARGQQQPPGNTPIFVHEYEAGFREVTSGVSQAVLWRHHDRRSYGAFTRFEPEFGPGVHTYPHDTWIVVIQGAYVYEDDAGEKRRVERGDFIRIPGGTRHRSGGDAQWGALFYEESSASVFTNTAGDTRGPRQQQNDAPVFVPIDEAGFREVVPGVSRAVLWGDDDKGPYGAFTEFEPEFDSGPHTHSHDIRIVVIQGFYVYSDDAGEKRFGPGDFIRIPGGTKHRSGGDRKWGVVFYEASDGKSDWVPVR